MLQETDRQKLDGIVQQMTANKESDDNIQFVVNDFKNRYDKTPESKPGFISGVKEDFTKRADLTQQAVDQTGVSLPEKGLRVAGQAAGLATDILGQGISKLTPDIIEKPIKTGVQKIAETTPVKSVVEKYGEWKKAHPRAAANLEAGVNIASLLPYGTATEGAKEASQGLLTKGAGVLERSAASALENDKSSFIRELVRPIQTKAVKEAQVARTTEQGSGIFKKSVVEPTAQELKAEQAVMNVSGIRPKNTFQQNYIAVDKANVAEAQNLEKAVMENNFIIPKKEVVSKLNASKENLAYSPILVGDAEKTADKLLAGAIKIVNENEGTGSGLLKAKKQYDQWILSQKPKVFDANAENAFTVANREVRNVFKDILDTNAPNAKVKESLAKQSAMFTALENIGPKAAQEADTAFGRAFQNMMNAVGLKNKIVQQVAAIMGIGGLGAAATFAPAAAVTGIGGFLLYKGGKFIINPRLRLVTAQFIREIDRATPLIKDRVIRNQMILDVGVLKSVLKENSKQP